MLNNQDRNASLVGWSFIVIRISNNFKFIYCIGIYVLLLQNSRISRNKVQFFLAEIGEANPKEEECFFGWTMTKY